VSLSDLLRSLSAPPPAGRSIHPTETLAYWHPFNTSDRHPDVPTTNPDQALLRILWDLDHGGTQRLTYSHRRLASAQSSMRSNVFGKRTQSTTMATKVACL